MSTSKVYSKGSFLTRTNYVIKTYEQSYSITAKDMKFLLLPQKIIEEYKTECNYLHIGLVQLAIKP